MTPDEFCARAAEIREERELSSWQESDLALYCRIVQRTQRVTELDEYYLTIVGVPSRGYLVKLQGKAKKKVVSQGVLF